MKGNIRVNLRGVDKISTVGIVGCGLIGIGWITLLLSRGYRVIAADTNPNAEEQVRAGVSSAWKELERLGLNDEANQNNLTFETSLEKLCDGADFVQENVPDSVELKQKILSQLDSFTPPDRIISSSTSGIIKSVLDERCAHKERIVVGHPFYPVHLMPLVEVVADPAAGSITEAFYTSLGKSVVVLHQDVPGFIANRFQEAIWREALHMVKAGEATPEQIDCAIVNGPGIRWPITGPFMSYELGCGSGGVEALITELYEEPMPENWSRTPRPEITPELEQAIREGSNRLCGDTKYEERVADRNRKIMAILDARQK